jgi:hypothetical protein
MNAQIRFGLYVLNRSISVVLYFLSLRVNNLKSMLLVHMEPKLDL